MLDEFALRSKLQEYIQIKFLLPRNYEKCHKLKAKGFWAMT